MSENSAPHDYPSEDYPPLLPAAEHTANTLGFLPAQAETPEGTEPTQHIARVHTEETSSQPAPALPESINIWRQIGRALRLFEVEPPSRTSPDRARPAGRIATRLAQATERVTAATERLREQSALDKQEEVGDEMLLAVYRRFADQEYAVADCRAKRYDERATVCTAKAQTNEQRGGLLGTIFSWLNRSVATFYRWRKRSALNKRNYFAEGF